MSTCTAPPSARSRRIALALLIGASVVACRKRAPAVLVDAAPPERVVSVRRGLASHYGARFAGRTTASGELYDPELMTAAHRTLAFGTRIRVSRAEGRGSATEQVIVRINDRGPYAEERLVDLSDAAARRLGMLGTVARVKLEVLAPLAGSDAARP